MSLPHITTLNTNSIKNASYHLRPAAIEDAYEIWTVMDTCSKSMVQKDHFICDDLEYVRDILSEHGFGVVACDTDGKIVGNLLVKYPGLTKENLGYDVFISYNQNTFPAFSFKNQVSPKFRESDEKSFTHNILLTSENLKRVVHMDSASVLLQHRGHGLESEMIAFAENLIDTSKYCYSFATVAPENMASLKSLEKNGYQEMVTKEKYGGVTRCVMMKKL